MAILGTLLCVAGIGLGIYLGVFVMFIGGIMQIATHLNPVNAVEIAWGIIKILFASPVGWVSGVLPFLFGLGIIKASE